MRPTVGSGVEEPGVVEGVAAASAMSPEKEYIPGGGGGHGVVTARGWDGRCGYLRPTVGGGIEPPGVVEVTAVPSPEEEHIPREGGSHGVFTARGRSRGGEGELGPGVGAGIEEPGIVKVATARVDLSPKEEYVSRLGSGHGVAKSHGWGGGGEGELPPAVGAGVEEPGVVEGATVAKSSEEEHIPRGGDGHGVVIARGRWGRDGDLTPGVGGGVEPPRVVEETNGDTSPEEEHPRGDGSHGVAISRDRGRGR